ncbi:MAG: ribonuclease HIII [Mycoplasmataceae bacterium]|jgi:ribonuclease HIII|nr:ribonuclease HIII [Mycoplasmataceae bacterium]
MNTFSIVLNNDQIKKILSFLHKYQLTKPDNPNIYYFFKYKGTTISIFKTKKMFIQGKDADVIGEELVNKKEIAKVVTKAPVTKNTKVSSDYIGADEVGVGDYFGGLVTCACYVKHENEAKLKELGVRDSKDLTDEQMNEMYSDVVKLVDFEVNVQSPEQYNSLVKKFKNTHIVKTYMHDLAIKKLSNKLNIGVIDVVMDQYVDEKNYYGYFKIIGCEPYPIKLFLTKAENKFLAVACASIIARVAFLQQINQLRRTSKINFHLGSSDKNIVSEAKAIYDKGGIELLNKFVKIDFKTTEKVKN